MFRFRPKKFTLKGYKRYWFTYKDLHLFLFKSRENFRSNEAPAIVINLRGCEVTPEVTLAQGKFNIKLEVPPEDGVGANSEMWIRCDNVRNEFSFRFKVHNTNHIKILSALNNFTIHRKINMQNGWLPVV